MPAQPAASAASAVPPVPPVRRSALLARRIAAAVTALLAVACTGLVLGWAAGSPGAEVQLLATGRADFDSLLPAGAGLLAWVGLAWFGVLLGLEFGSLCPSAGGQLCAAAATRFAPQIARTCARFVLGMALVAGPLVSTSAMAAPAGGPPNLDRPVAAASAPSGAAATPALDLDRPTAGYLPPAPPPLTKTAPASPSLLAPTPRREVVDDGYVVRRGDSLWDVAARHLGADATAADIAREWPRWYAQNQAVIGIDPGVLHPGQVLHAPRN
ncbi:MAG: LysM peptidoglycan-binding domain-containing protein [Acidothermaceae bacterium]